MNLTLKLKILEKYGSQARFADEIGENESAISRVIHGRKWLPREKRLFWATTLEANERKLFQNQQ
jgi:hypothetical protein